MKKVMYIILVLVVIFSLGGCGDAGASASPEATSAVAESSAAVESEVVIPESSAEIVPWPEKFAEIPAYTASAISDLTAVDDYTGSMQFSGVTDEEVAAYVALLESNGFIAQGTEGNNYAKITSELSYSVGWNRETSEMKMILMIAPTTEEDKKLLTNWPVELDGIPSLDGYMANSAAKNKDGLITVDYSGVADADIEAYRAKLTENRFELVDIGTGVEAYVFTDGIGNEFLVVVNPQDDVAGHLQISGIITPAK